MELSPLVFVAVVWTAVVAARHLQASVPAWAPALPAYAIGTIAMFCVIDRTLAFVP